jgi:protein SCO1/2
MNHKLIPRLVWAHFIMVALGVGFIYASARSDAQKRPNDLPIYKQVPDFHLIDQQGRSVRLRDLEGKVWVADFIFTNCPGPCPIMTRKLSEIQDQAFDNKNVRFVSITADPDRDTPQVLHDYAEKNDAQRQWLFLTGEKAEIAALANKGFMLALLDQPGAEQPVVHSTKMALVDQAGFIRGFYEGTDDHGIAEILRDVKRLSR